MEVDSVNEDERNGLLAQMRMNAGPNYGGVANSRVIEVGTLRRLAALLERVTLGTEVGLGDWTAADDSELRWAQATLAKWLP